MVYTATAAEVGLYERHWDEITHTPYYFPDGQSQVWYDDVQSLGDKIGWSVDQGMLGVGFWALNYEGGDPAFWDMVAEHTQVPDPPETGGDSSGEGSSGSSGDGSGGSSGGGSSGGGETGGGSSVGPGGTGGGSGDAASSSGADDASTGARQDGGDDGCGCAQAGGAGATIGWAALGLAGLVRRRRGRG